MKSFRLVFLAAFEDIVTCHPRKKTGIGRRARLPCGTVRVALLSPMDDLTERRLNVRVCRAYDLPRPRIRGALPL